MVSLDQKGQLGQNLYDVGNNINANTSWYNPAAVDRIHPKPDVQWALERCHGGTTET